MPPWLMRLRELRLTMLVGGCVVGALGFSAAALEGELGSQRSGFGASPVVTVIFIGLVVAAENRALPWLSDRSDGSTTGSWIFAFTLLFVSPAPVALGAIAGASVLADLRARKALTRVLFNASQLVVSLGAAAAVLTALSDPLALATEGSVSLRWLAAAGLAVATAFGINNVLSATAVALHQGLAVWPVVTRSIGVNLGRDGLEVCLAPICALAAVHGVTLLPLALVAVWSIDTSAGLALRSRLDARHDVLTGLANRRLLVERAGLALAAATNQQRVAVIHVDLDRFKAINDRLGHNYGDRVLADVARRLGATRRATDLVARIGGDEFVVLATNLADEVAAATVAERVLQAIRQQVVLDGIPLSVGASVGVALAPDHGTDFDTLLRRADQAMYAAKSAGGDGAHLYRRDPHADAVSVPALLAEVTAALASREMMLEFQPVADLATGAVTAMSARLCWQHPRLGMLATDTFRHQADGTDLGPALTERLLALATTAAAAWRADGHQVPVSLRLSSGAVADGGLVQRVEAALRASGLDPAGLRLVIAEDALRSSPSASTAVPNGPEAHLRGLQERGVAVDLAEFGSGNSSLVELRRLPFERLQLAAPFLIDLDHRGADLHATGALVALARTLGWRTVADGVAELGVIEVLRGLGVDFVSGPLLGTPRTQDELSDWFAAWPSRSAMLGAAHRSAGETVDAG